MLMLLIMAYIGLYCAGTELIQFNIVNIMVADALAPYVTRSSAAMILCRIGRSLSYMRKDFNYLCHVNVEQCDEI